MRFVGKYSRILSWETLRSKRMLESYTGAAILFLIATGIAVGMGMADRKSVGEGKSVDLGGRRIIKKKTSHQ